MSTSREMILSSRGKNSKVTHSGCDKRISLNHHIRLWFQRNKKHLPHLGKQPTGENSRQPTTKEDHHQKHQEFFHSEDSQRNGNATIRLARSKKLPLLPFEITRNKQRVHCLSIQLFNCHTLFDSLWHHHKQNCKYINWCTRTCMWFSVRPPPAPT